MTDELEKEGGQTVDVEGPQSGGEVAPSSDVTELQQALADVGFWSREAERLLYLIHGGVDCNGGITLPLKIMEDDQGSKWLAIDIVGAARVHSEAVPSNGLNPDPSPKGQEAEGWRDCHGLDTPERVCFYEQDFYVLSNFSSFEVEWASSGRFKTAEHLYHWLRFATGEANGKLGGAQPSAMAVAIADRVRRAPSAHEAFKIAQDNKHLQRADWNEVKVEKMRMVIRAKAMQHEYVLRKLLATSDRELVENSWRDDFWGWGENRDGQNVLGKLWMEVRSELRAAAPLATSPTRDEAP